MLWKKNGYKIVSAESILETNPVYQEHINLKLLYLIYLVHFLVWCNDP